MSIFCIIRALVQLAEKLGSAPYQSVNYIALWVVCEMPRRQDGENQKELLFHRRLVPAPPAMLSIKKGKGEGTPACSALWIKVISGNFSVLQPKMCSWSCVPLFPYSFLFFLSKLLITSERVAMLNPLFYVFKYPMNLPWKWPPWKWGSISLPSPCYKSCLRGPHWNACIIWIVFLHPGCEPLGHGQFKAIYFMGVKFPQNNWNGANFVAYI